jgi:hypothetical protein
MSRRRGYTRPLAGPADWLAFVVHLRRVRLRACLRALGVTP